MTTKMAEIVFIGSTKDEQELAKKFWKVLSHNDGQQYETKAETKMENSPSSSEDTSLKRFWAEAEKRQKADEDERFQRFEESKNESQLLLSKRREERFVKENISRDIANDKDYLVTEYYAGDEDVSNEIEAMETRKCIDDFEKRLKRV